MRIEKYHASGNDFLIVDEQLEPAEEFARKLCSRHTSVGADGLMYIPRDSFSISFYNADGSSAAVCGNGLRCAGLYLCRHGRLIEEAELLMGQRSYRVRLHRKDPYDAEIFFPKEQGKHRRLFTEQRIGIHRKSYELSVIDVGNPHAVCIVKTLRDIPFHDAKKISMHPMFRGGINVDFVQILSPEEVKILTYERGVGFTSSCGSGALASSLVLHRKGLLGETIRVVNPLGDLLVSVEESYSIRGGASFLFEVNLDVRL